MSRLRVLWNPPLELADAPLAAEVLNQELERLFLLLVPSGGTSVGLDQGDYIVRARLPSGRTSQVSVRVTELGGEVALRAPHSPHEWLRRQTFLGDYTEVAAAEETKAAINGLDPQLWWFEDGEWRPTQVALRFERDFDFDLGVAVYRVRVQDPRRLYLVEIASESIPRRFVALPIPSDGEVELLVRPARVPTSHNGRVSVKVSSQDMRTETLLRYLTSGAVDAALTVAMDVLPSTMDVLAEADGQESQFAEQLLRQKLHNPFAAAIGGYYGLRIGNRWALYHLPHDFSERFPWLPDSAIVHAWQMLRSSAGDPDLELVRARLLQATRNGVPTFAAGLRLLIDGLDMCVTDARDGGFRDEELEHALTVVRRYAALTDWSQDVTTFFATHPGDASNGPRRKSGFMTLSPSKRGRREEDMVPA